MSNKGNENSVPCGPSIKDTCKSAILSQNWEAWKEEREICRGTENRRISHNEWSISNARPFPVRKRQGGNARSRMFKIFGGVIIAESKKNVSRLMSLS